MEIQTAFPFRILVKIMWFTLGKAAEFSSRNFDRQECRKNSKAICYRRQEKSRINFFEKCRWYLLNENLKYDEYSTEGYISNRWPLTMAEIFK